MVLGVQPLQADILNTSYSEHIYGLHASLIQLNMSQVHIVGS